MSPAGGKSMDLMFEKVKSKKTHIYQKKETIPQHYQAGRARSAAKTYTLRGMYVSFVKVSFLGLF